MAWDVLVVRLPQGTRRIGALPADYWPPSFEPPQELIARLRVVPGIELMGETLAVVRSSDWVVEVDFSTPTRVLLRVEGAESSLEIVKIICERLGAAAIDTTTGETLDFGADPSSSGGASGLRRSRAREEFLETISDSTPTANDTTKRRAR